MKLEHRKIYCEKCGRKVATWDRKSSMNIEVKCKHCKKLVIFRPSNGTVEMRSLPNRISASAVRFL